MKLAQLDAKREVKVGVTVPSKHIERQRISRIEICTAAEKCFQNPIDNHIHEVNRVAQAQEHRAIWPLLHACKDKHKSAALEFQSDLCLPVNLLSRFFFFFSFFLSYSIVKSAWVKQSVEQSQVQNQKHLLIVGPCFYGSWMSAEWDIPYWQLLFKPCFAVLADTPEQTKGGVRLPGNSCVLAVSSKIHQNYQAGRRNIH